MKCPHKPKLDWFIKKSPWKLGLIVIQAVAWVFVASWDLIS